MSGATVWRGQANLLFLTEIILELYIDYILSHASSRSLISDALLSLISKVKIGDGSVSKPNHALSPIVVFIGFMLNIPEAVRGKFCPIDSPL